MEEENKSLHLAIDNNHDSWLYLSILPHKLVVRVKFQLPRRVVFNNAYRWCYTTRADLHSGDLCADEEVEFFWRNVNQHGLMSYQGSISNIPRSYHYVHYV